MSGGNRAFTLQDVLGQLNQDASGQSAQDDSALQINQLALLSDGVTVADAVTFATRADSIYWNGGATWGDFQWYDPNIGPLYPAGTLYPSNSLYLGG